MQQIDAFAGSIGQSYDLFKGEAGNSIFNPGATDKYWRNAETSVIYELQLVETQKSLSEWLSMSASASYSGIVGNAGMRAEATRSLVSDELSLSILVSVKVQLETRGPVDCILKDDVAKALDERDLTAFVATFGTGAIISETLGGQLLAITQIFARSATEKNDMRASLTGSFGAYGAHADFAASLTRILKEKHISRYINRTGADGPIPRLEDLVAYSENFSDLVRTANTAQPRPMALGYQDFTRLAFSEKVQNATEKKLRLLDLEKRFAEQDDTLRWLLSKRSDAKAVKDTIDRMLLDPSFPFDRADAKLKQSDAEAIIVECDKMAKGIAIAPLTKFVPKNFDVPVYRPIDDSAPVIPLTVKCSRPPTNLTDMGDWIMTDVGGFQNFSIELGSIYTLQDLSISYISFDFQNREIFRGKDGQVAPGVSGLAISLSGSIAHKYSINYEMLLEHDPGGGGLVERTVRARNGVPILVQNYSVKGLRIWLERRAP